MRKKSLLSKFALLVTALVMGVSSAWADSYSLATSLSVGDQVILVNAGLTKELGGISSTATTYGLANDVKEYTFAGAYLLTVEEGDADDSFAFKTSNGAYLSWSSGNSLTTATSVSEASSWTVSFDEEGKATIKNVSDESRMLQYNSGSPRFACYTSVQTAVNFYIKESSGKTAVATIADDLTPLTVNIEEKGDFSLTITAASNLEENTDYVVVWESSDDEILEVTDNAYEAKAKGSVTITVTVTPDDDEVYEEVSKTFTVRVVDPNANDGSAEKPYTVAEAIEFINSLGQGNTEDDVYVKGIISKVDKFDPTNKWITYWISDDGTTEGQLQVYRGKGKDAAEFSSIDDIAVGDAVTVNGTVTLFKSGNNLIPEFAANSQIVAYTTKLAAGLSFEETEFAVSMADISTFAAPELINPNSVSPITWSWTGSPNTVEALDENTGELTLAAVKGTVTITASFAGDDTYKVGSASYTVTVYDPNVKGSIYNPYTVAEVIDGTAEGSGIYVKGFIVGSYNSKAPRTGSSAEASNLALADSYVETDGSNTIPVQLSNNTTPRTEFNVVDNPYNIGVAQVVVKANADTYFSTKGLKNTSEITKIAEQVSISDAGMATYYTDCALDFSNFADMQAFTASLDGNELTFTRVNKVPANTAVLLYNPNGGAATNLVPVTDSPEAVRSALQGTLVEKTGEAGEYILLNGENGPGFYQATDKKIAAHKAYVNGPTSSARFFGINLGGEATGINAAAVKAIYNEGVYNLNGQRVVKTQKGLYIVNGKKMVVR